MVKKKALSAPFLGKVFPFREMPREEGFTCKKRHHPDGLHLSTSSPKRLLSISEAVLDSSIDSAIDSPTLLRHSLDSARGSLWNLASSAVITSDCSTSMCAGHSTMYTNVVSSKPPSFDLAHSQTPSDSLSYNPEVSKSARGSAFKENGKGIWMYRSATSKCEAESECSDVTHARSSIFRREPEAGVSSSGKATHIISRREKSSLNPKWGMDEAWAKDAFGYGDTLVREKRLESNISLHSTSERRECTYSSMACESASSCATGDSYMEEIRPKQGSCYISGSVCKEPFAASPIVHTKGEAVVGPRAQERSGGLDHFNAQGHLSFDVDMHSSFTRKGKTEELSPAYVLSSGRLSLEEEARLGRRAPTIDHDFEEYFSSLMLE